MVVKRDCMEFLVYILDGERNCRPVLSVATQLGTLKINLRRKG